MSEITALGRVRFHGVLDNRNVSGVSLWRGNAVIVTDERVDSHKNVMQILEPHGNDFRARPDGVIVLGQGQEMDLEGVAIHEDTVYVLGSHSWRRKMVKPPGSYKLRRAALLSPPQAEKARDVLIRVKLNSAGAPRQIKITSLRHFLNRNEPFASFSKIASKENGIDAEGLAIWKGQLYVGFRGPVLRDNFACVLRCGFGPPITKPTTLFAELGGRGVRDLAHVKHGLIILAGPVGDGPGSYQLYFWDGNDCVPHDPEGNKALGLKLLSDLPKPQRSKDSDEKVAKAEGIALVSESTNHWELIVVYDGLKDGHGIRFRVRKPSAPAH